VLEVGTSTKVTAVPPGVGEGRGVAGIAVGVLVIGGVGVAVALANPGVRLGSIVLVDMLVRVGVPVRVGVLLGRGVLLVMGVVVGAAVCVLDGEAAGVAGVAGVVVAVGLLQSLVYNKENVLRGLLPPLRETPAAIALPGDKSVTPKRVLVVVPELALLARVH
jgi:hypothetical protein